MPQGTLQGSQQPMLRTDLFAWHNRAPCNCCSMHAWQVAAMHACTARSRWLYPTALIAAMHLANLAGVCSRLGSMRRLPCKRKDAQAQPRGVQLCIMRVP